MRKDNQNQRINTKVKKMIQKTCMVVTLSVVCTTAGFQGSIPNSYQTVAAATQSSFTSIVPGFSIQSRNGKTATLKIQSVSQASYYKVYRSTSKNGSYTYVGQTSSTTYKDTGLTAGKVYYYKIKAANSTSASQYSKAVKLNATLSKVSGVNISYSNGSAKLSWSSVSGAKKYRVYRSTSKNGTYQYIGNTSVTSYQDSSVSAGTTYYYRVRAVKTISKVKYFGVYSAKASVTCSSSNSGNTGSSDSTSATESSYIEKVLRLVNVERAKEGLSALTTTQPLKNAAYQRAVEIKSVFSHNRPDGSSCFTALGEFNVSYTAAGENIAYGQKTPAAVVEGWMNSEGHRANIMSSKFGKVGIGCYQSGGVYYWTQLFTN